jgi:4'-phosphopantetheinyl transferase
VANSQPDNWRPQRHPDQLHTSEVHLWSVSLDTPSEKSGYFRSTLSADEKERADRFLKIEDCELYTITRGALRSFLGAYLAIEPREVEFAYGALGKPSLLHMDGAHAALNFSVSHSGGQALLGFARGRRIGVDLERVSADADVLELAERYFSSNEFETLRSLTAELQHEAFYCGWTRKEAYLKARGEGIFFGLERVEVSLIPGERAVIKKVSDDPNVSENWILEHLLPAPNYIGAVAAEGHDLTFRFFRWEPD